MKILSREAINRMVGNSRSAQGSQFSRGGGGGGGQAVSLANLSDVAISTPIDGGSVLTFDETAGKWVAGPDVLTTMWDALSATGTEQIDASHLTGVLGDYATETWVSQNYISIAYFDRLFRAYNGNTLVSHNDETSTIDNIKAMFGFWTEQYLSALGNSGGGSVSLTLANMGDVSLNNLADGQVLTYNATTGKWVNANPQGGVTDLASLTDVTLTTPSANQVLLYDGTTSKWINSGLKTINGESIYGSGNIVVGGGGSGYLPLTGGTLTNASFGGALTINRSTAGKASVIRYSNSDGALGSLGFDSSGNPAYWPGSSSSTADETLLATQSWADGKFLPLAGGTMTGDINMTRGGSLASATKIKWGSSYLSGNNSGTVGMRLSGTDVFSIRSLSNTSLGLSISSESVNVDNVLNISGVNEDGKRGVRIHQNGNYSQIYFGCTTDSGYEAGMWTIDLATSYGMRFRGTSSTSSTSRSNYIVIAYGGNVGIGVTSPNYKLHVDGTLGAGNTSVANLESEGYVSALSDIRKKEVLEYMDGLTIEQIAEAPIIKFLWKERPEDGLQVGSIAQYWQKVLPQSVHKSKNDYLSFSYGVAALVGTISNSRELVKHDARLSRIEKMLNINID